MGATRATVVSYAACCVSAPPENQRVFSLLVCLCFGADLITSQLAAELRAETRIVMSGVVWEVAKKGERGSFLIGSRVRIWWDGDRLWYEGIVVR